MMNFIDYCVSSIKYAGLSELLEIALASDIHKAKGFANLDNLIETKVLSRFVVDASLSRGVEVDIPLDKCELLVGDLAGNNFIYKIPNDLTNGRRIMSAHNTLINSPSSTPIDKTTALGLAQQMNRNIVGPYNGVANIKLTVISRDEIMIEYTQGIPMGAIKVVLAYDDKLSDIQPRYNMELSTIAILCAKAFVYKELHIAVATGAMWYGHNLEAISSLVSSFDESNAEYMERMNVEGARMLMMNDSQSMSDFLQQQIGSIT